MANEISRIKINSSPYQIKDEELQNAIKKLKGESSGSTSKENINDRDRTKITK